VKSDAAMSFMVAAPETLVAASADVGSIRLDGERSECCGRFGDHDGGSGCG
jgi:hypothetical protein